ncbi:MAG: hypothetical protein JWO52_3608 [Gammaproteobacteria bacterium]|nr:hypothetical protein [Gammaproteobacteria bacterium]
MALKQAFYYLPLALDCSVRRQCRSLFSAYKSINFLILGLERLLSEDYGGFARVHVEAVGAAVTNACDKGTHGTSARGKSRCKMHPDRDNRRPGIEILVQRSETAAPGPQISASTPGNRHETRTRCPRAPPPHGVLISAVNAADSMWAMLAAPLIAGNDLSNMDAATKTIFSTKKSSPWIRTARDSGTSCRANWQCRRLGKTTDRRRRVVALLNRGTVPRRLRLPGSSSVSTAHFGRRVQGRLEVRRHFEQRIRTALRCFLSPR